MGTRAFLGRAGVHGSDTMRLGGGGWGPWSQSLGSYEQGKDRVRPGAKGTGGENRRPARRGQTLSTGEAQACPFMLPWAPRASVQQGSHGRGWASYPKLGRAGDNQGLDVVMPRPRSLGAWRRHTQAVEVLRAGSWTERGPWHYPPIPEQQMGPRPQKDHPWLQSTLGVRGDN